jgi:pSer/pThr/pTyr-binding forkhead associated (FHA) protein
MQEDWNITISVLDCPDKSFIGQQKVFFTSPISIGRAENNDLIVPDPTVSRNHAILRITNDYTRVFITDMSTHGTEVSGRQVPKGRGTGFTIENGDTIKMGDTLLRYELKLKISVQSTFVGKMDKSFLEIPPEPVEPIPEPKRAVPIYDSKTQEQTRKGISPIAIAIIIVCLILMVYIVFFAK